MENRTLVWSRNNHSYVQVLIVKRGEVVDLREPHTIVEEKLFFAHVREYKMRLPIVRGEVISLL